MRIDKDYKGLIDEGYRYKIEGDIITTESLVIDLNKGLYVTGCIEADGDIKSGWSIEAGWFIKAGGSIESGGYIYSVGSIKASWSIKANGSIEADVDIKAGGVVNHGILKELGLPEESDDKTEEAMKLLKEKGYRIVKV